MAYAIAAGSVLSYTYRGTLYGQTVMNTFHYRLDTTGVLADGGVFLSDFFDAMNAAGQMNELYLEAIPAQVITVEADVQWINPDRFVKRTFFIAGTGGAPWVPTGTNQAMVLTVRADVADRRSVGDKHIPGLGGTAISSGLVQPAARDALSDLGEACRLDVAVGGRTMTPIVFGRARPAYVDKHGVTHPALPVSRRPITDFKVQTTARVMRRRTVGVGD